MTNFDKYCERYNRGGCTIDQLRRLTQLGALKPAEFETITGETYAKSE